MMYRFVSLLTFLTVISPCFGQSEAEIDSIFSHVNNPDNPAVAATILHKGEVVYQKAFGRVNLDFEQQTTVDTKFEIAGLAKHFTAFAVLLLEKEGELSLSDDIRKYLPELPEYSKTITIRHLLSLSSGLHGYWALKELAGVHRDDVLTREQALKLIGSQSELSYDPGTDYSYTNTGQTLLAEIVASVSGKSFASYAKEQLFDPLQMTNTLFKDDFEQYIPNVAASYEPDGDGFKESALNVGVPGPTNLYSTVVDLAKWEMNLQDPKVGSKSLVEKLNSAATLDNGSTLDPLFGRVTLGQQLIHMERGIFNIYQTGTLGGYASSIFKFTEQDFTVIVLSSGMYYSGYLGMQSAYLYLDDIFPEPSTVDFQSLKTKKLSSKKLEAHVGSYWDQRASSSRNIEVIDDTLRYVRGGGRNSALIPLSDTEFQMMAGGDEKILVRFLSGESKKMEFTIGESAPIVFEQYVPTNYSANQLETFTGTFLCKELSTSYQFSIKENLLTASHIRNNDVSFSPVTQDLFVGGAWLFGSIKYERNQSNDISGFWLSTDRVRKLWFEKI
ncbi:MAG: serine hydrolase domain-containing protein [Cyclobacteriaceae bacterium]